MRIEIGNFALCGGRRANEYPTGLTINNERTVQVEELIGGTAQRVFERGNVGTTVAFSVVREHADLRAALDYAVQHHAGIPAKGPVRLISEGKGQTTHFLRDGQLQSHKVDPIIGVTTVHSYTLVGGDLTLTQPKEIT